MFRSYLRLRQVEGGMKHNVFCPSVRPLPKL